MLKYWAGVDGRWVGAAVGAARGSLVNNRWVGSGYGRWVGGTFSDSRASTLQLRGTQDNFSASVNLTL